MPIAEAAAFLAVLIVVFVFGNLWFHLVEALLRQIKRRLPRRREPPAWHPFPTDDEDAETR